MCHVLYNKDRYSCDTGGTFEETFVTKGKPEKRKYIERSLEYARSVYFDDTDLTLFSYILFLL